MAQKRSARQETISFWWRLKALKQVAAWHGLIPLAVFLVLTLPAGAFLISNVPALWSADGGAHVARVFQIAEGGFRAQYIDHNHGVGYGGNIPLNVNDLKNLELNIVGQSPAPPGAQTTKKILTAQDKIAIEQISKQKISKQRILISYVNTAAYSLFAYAPNALGVYVGMTLNFSLGHTLLLARLCSFAAFVLCVAYSLYTLRHSQLKWIVMTVSLLPLVVFQSTVITADSFLYSVSILFSSLIIKGLSSRLTLTLADKILLFICVGLLPLLKSVYFLLVFLVLLLPKRQWGSTRAYWLWNGPALVISMIGFGIWTAMTTDIAASNGLVRGDLLWTYGDATVQRNFVLRHPLGYVHVLMDSIFYTSKTYTDTFFGWIGFTYLPIPGVAEVAGYLSLGLSVLMAGSLRLKKYVAAYLLAAVGATALLIFTTLYIYYTQVMRGDIEGVQGRYFLPLTILFLVGVAGCLPKLRVQSEGANTAKILLTCLISFCFVYSIFRYGVAITT